MGTHEEAPAQLPEETEAQFYAQAELLSQEEEEEEAHSEVLEEDESHLVSQAETLQEESGTVAQVEQVEPVSAHMEPEDDAELDQDDENLFFVDVGGDSTESVAVNEKRKADEEEHLAAPRKRLKV